MFLPYFCNPVICTIQKLNTNFILIWPQFSIRLVSLFIFTSHRFQFKKYAQLKECDLNECKIKNSQFQVFVISSCKELQMDFLYIPSVLFSSDATEIPVLKLNQFQKLTNLYLLDLLSYRLHIITKRQADVAQWTEVKVNFWKKGAYNIHFISHKNAQLLKNPQTVKRQSGKSKICKNYTQNPQYLGKEEKKIYTNVTALQYQLHISIHTNQKYTSHVYKAG